MPLRVFVALVLMVIFVAGMVLLKRHLSKSNLDDSKPSPLPGARIGPESLYPDPQLTPGKADTLDRFDLIRRYPCTPSIHKPSCTYSQSHRYVPKQIHTMVYEEYDVPRYQRNGEDGEVDHLNPACNGGSNDMENLWYQPAINPWEGKNFGYHEKDALEEWICAEVKAGILDPAEAFRKITLDWVAYYLDTEPGRLKAQVVPPGNQPARIVEKAY